VKQIALISGKGGTGKTVLTASFAALAKKACFVDCDVDAADLHLLLHPTVRETNTFRSGYTAQIDMEECTGCGQCVEVCRFNAIRADYHVDPVACEGCRICSYVCPVGAIKMEENVSGEWYVSQTKYGPFVHARLGIAEENSGKLVTKIRQAAQAIATKDGLDYVIIDGPPGIGCPVIASLSGVDCAIIVTEPTISGIHDMERVAGVARHFSIPAACVVNKHDINPDNTARIEKWCQDNGLPMLGKMLFDHSVTASISAGVPVVEHTENLVTIEIRKIWERVNDGDLWR
jgi:MinD superfamily P-loop ATPase